MGNLFGNIKKKISDRMDAMPIWAEFTLFLAVIMILLTIILSFSIYNREKRRTIDSQVMATQRLLGLKMTILEEYLKSLSDYAILPVYDSGLYSTMLSTGELSDESIEDVRSAARTYFYSRGGLLSYHIYLLNHDISVGRDNGQDGIRVRSIEDMKDSEIYRACAESKKNYAVLPSNDPKALFHFVHSIIRVQDKSIVALTDIEVDYSTMGYLSSQSITEGETLSLYNTDGKLLYTDADDELEESLEAFPPKDNQARFLREVSEGEVVYQEIDGNTYLLNVTMDADETLVMTSLVPLSDILSQVRQTRFFATMIGLIFLLLAVAAANALIRYLSAPLSTLVSIQEGYGEGEVVDARLGRSRESAELSRSFNHMTKRIDTLIKENYAAELNEKNARLATLEAQLNPHFLYNTLQAIGSEALLNDQSEIYNMLISLASNLRYTIKAPNVVTLGDEMKYVDNYITLQKIRMGDRLIVEQHIYEDTLGFLVPKISVQTLIENSIIHGIAGERTSIRIELDAGIENERLVIKVRDDGVGIEQDELARIRNNFRTQTLTDANQSIGLANLYNRLLLLYGEGTDMQIDSKVGAGSFTSITLTLPEISKEN